MSLTLAIAMSTVIIAFTFHIVSIGLAIGRLRNRHPTLCTMENAPAVTIIRPVCGLEEYSARTLGSSFSIDWPDYEIIFCAASQNDPVLDLIRFQIARNPNVKARIVVDATRRFENPKLDNMHSGWRLARHDWIVFVDSNVLLPPSYLHGMFAAWKNTSGMVSAPPVGSDPQTFWATVECEFLNSWQARIQYAVDSLGFGFAQGKNLFFRRQTLEKGGFEQLANAPAEDAAATKLIRARGERVSLAAPPFAQPLGHRTFAQIWGRQLRWAKLRRKTFPRVYGPEILAGPLFPLIAFVVLLVELNVSPLLAMAYPIVWYTPEVLLVRLANWPLSVKTPVAMVARDLLLLPIFLASFLNSRIEWNGKVIEMRPKRTQKALAELDA